MRYKRRPVEVEAEVDGRGYYVRGLNADGSHGFGAGWVSRDEFERDYEPAMVRCSDEPSDTCDCGCNGEPISEPPPTSWCDDDCTHAKEPLPAEGEPTYPCDRCGVLRTKAEGGTTFTVCDECWDALHPAPTVTPGDGCRVVDLADRDLPKCGAQVEPGKTRCKAHREKEL